jgi:hypothetical protein
MAIFHLCQDPVVDGAEPTRLMLMMRRGTSPMLPFGNPHHQERKAQLHDSHKLLEYPQSGILPVLLHSIFRLSNLHSLSQLLLDK